MSSECCTTSCWCAPCRWIVSCLPCCKKKTPSQQTVYSVSVAAIGTPTVQPEPTPTHHRERTWKLSDGRMTYDHKETGIG